MLIKALSDYYDILEQKGELLPEEFSYVKIHYIISLSLEGKILDIIDWRQEVQKGTKLVKEPRKEVLPKRIEKSGIESNVLDHRPLYLFGLNAKKDIFNDSDKTDKAKKSHYAFVEKNLDFVEGIDIPVVQAYKAFIKNFNPIQETENPFLLEIIKDYGMSGFSFCLDGKTDELLHKNKELLNKWKKSYETEKEDSGGKRCCAILGEESEIARIHSKIKTFNAMGSVLIGVKEEAMCSYGNEQGNNAQISNTIMKKYTTALNYVLEDSSHYIMLDDLKIVFFAMNKDNRYDDVFSSFFTDFSVKNDFEDMQQFLESLMKNTKDASVTEPKLEIFDNLDENVDFYIIGFKPNASRIALKFIDRRKFGKLLQNIVMHQKDLAMSGSKKSLALWMIKNELKSPKSKSDEVDPSIISKLLESIIKGYRYPTALLSTIVRRVKIDSDSDMHKKVNETRVRALKACINRDLRLNNKKEEITMSLDKENSNEAYLCGRLFAVLENLQKDASGGKLNTTIKDSYFSSACTKPAIVFPKLLRLAQNHLSKAAYGKNRNYEISEIMDKLKSHFPETLTLTEQGKFIIGYYQQMASRFEKHTEEKEEI